MVSLLGISFVVAAAAAQAKPVEAKPLDPKIEAVLAFVTDFKALGKLRGGEVVVRLRGLAPVKETEKFDYRWHFEGEPAEGPIKLAQIQFEEGPRLKKALFLLRVADYMEMQPILAKRLGAKLGKPKTAYQNSGARVAVWHIGKEWIVGVAAQKNHSLAVDVVEWYDEPDDWEP